MGRFKSFRKLRLFWERLWSILTPEDRHFFLWLTLFSMVVSVIEVGGIGVIMPFIGIATNFENIFHYPILAELYNFLHFQSPFPFIIFIGVLLILFFLIRGGLNLLFYYLVARFAYGRYHKIAYRLFENFIGMKYQDFISKKSSDVVKIITTEAYYLTILLSQFMQLLSELLVALLIYSFLLWVNWKMTLLLTLFLGVNVYLMRRTISVKIRERGAERERLQRDFFELINSSFGNFKMIKLKGNEGELLSEFERASFGVARANISHSYLIEFPRIFLETLGFSIVVLIILYLILKYHRDITPDLPILSIFVLGLYRLLPSVNRIYRSFNHILFYLPSLEVVHNNLIYEPEELGDEPVQFQKQIEVRDLHFHFEEGKPVLKGVNLQIKKGEKIGIVGESGSGKSTLLDLLVGLYKPVKGEILVDGVPISSKNVKSWRRKIGYIPQNIYLIDGTIAENVAFGEEIDPDRVRRALEMANLLEFLEKHHQGIETRVGENGVKLSGGQKQRVAIARALYNDPEILVLDEATSALDQETERKIMDEIYRVGENRTLIIVAHRLSTLDRCNRVVKLRNGKIVEEE